MLRIFFIFTLFVGAASAQTTNNSYVDLEHDQNKKIFDCKGVVKRHIVKEFSIPNHLHNYKVDIYEDSISTLSINRNTKWFILDTLSNYTSFDVCLPCELILPSIQIIDFNNDGHLDLKIQMSTNINGNEWVELFLYNPLTQQINVLKNEAEDGIIWDAPKYQLKDSTIHCVRVAGVWGLSFESIYKLKGIQAFPLDKKEYDTTEMNYTGRGGIYRHYVGNKSKWKLIKKTTYRPH